MPQVDDPTKGKTHCYWGVKAGVCEMRRSTLFVRSIKTAIKLSQMYECTKTILTVEEFICLLYNLRPQTEFANEYH